MRKKFTMLLAALLACVGVMKAEVTDLPQMSTEGDIKWYTIKNVRTEKYATYAGDDCSMTQQTDIYPGSLFYFTGSVENNVATVKIHNLATSNLCNEASSWTGDGRDWYIAAKTQTGLSISKTDDFTGNNSWNDYQGKGKTVDHWKATDDGSIWAVELYEGDMPTIEEYATALDNANSMLYWMQEAYGLVKDASQFTCNHPSTQEGSYAGLLDGLYATYFHSGFGGEVGTDTHYMQIDLGENVAVSDFRFYMKKRSQNGNNRPKKITITASNTEDFSGEVCEPIEVTTTLADAVEFISDVISLTAEYRYIRFTINETNTGTKFFTLSEFYIFPATEEITSCIDAYRTFVSTSLNGCSNACIAVDEISNGIKSLFDDVIKGYDETQRFRLKSTASGLYMTIAATGQADQVQIQKYKEGNKGQMFTAIQDGDKYKIKSIDGYYLTAFSNWFYKADSNGNDGGTKHSLELVGNGKYMLHSTKGYVGTNSNATAENSPIYSNHNLDNPNIVWKLEPIAKDATVKYTYIYNGQTIDEEVFNLYKGEDFPKPTKEFPFGVVANVPEGEVSESIVEKEIELTLDLPFVPASSYSSITKWYYMNIHTDGYYLYHTAGATSMDLTKKTVDPANKDAYTWAFVGDPFNGYQIVNRATGESMILSSSTKVDGDGKSTHPVMTAVPVADGFNTYWIPTASDERGEGGFFLAQKGYESHKMNKRDGKLAYWTGGADGGSTFIVEERDLSGVVELKELIDEIEPEMAVWSEGTTVGCVTGESRANVASALNAAKTAVEKREGIDAAQAALQNAIDNVAIILPEQGKFYTLHSMHQNYVGRTAYVNAENSLYHNEGDDASHIFQFESVDGNLYLKSVERGTYLSNAPGHGGGQFFMKATSSAGAKKVAVNRVKGSGRSVNITPNGGAMIHAAASNQSYELLGWNNSEIAGASSWTIDEVEAFSHTLTISEVGWSSLILGFNATIPEGVEVYAVSEVGANFAALAPVAGVLPANTAVLVKAAEGSYPFVYSTESAEVSSKLSGTLYKTNVTPADGTICYVLSTGSQGVVGFYKATLNQEEGTSFRNNANKVYLSVETPSGVEPALALSFTRGEDTTGIENSEITIQNSTVIYDLLGRRVEKMEKGIYIVNGKKVIR